MEGAASKLHRLPLLFFDNTSGDILLIEEIRISGSISSVLLIPDSKARLHRKTRFSFVAGLRWGRQYGMI